MGKDAFFPPAAGPGIPRPIATRFSPNASQVVFPYPGAR